MVQCHSMTVQLQILNATVMCMHCMLSTTVTVEQITALAARMQPHTQPERAGSLTLCNAKQPNSSHPASINVYWIQALMRLQLLHMLMSTVCVAAISLVYHVRHL
eukprot:TRINITY_DN6739_c0_g1_i1.p2 TRINITY_DN6739_c0_g1~~TRINITY_DN6739_c0_g1_i1.p2  ORF type:complete len:105 (-),score=3.66 TRINITY_DN6739_c0_g1_i1:280-594(-)